MSNCDRILGRRSASWQPGRRAGLKKGISCRITCTHDDSNPTEIRGVAGGGFHQGKECDPLGPGLWGTEAKFRRSTFLGQRVLRHPTTAPNQLWQTDFTLAIYRHPPLSRLPVPQAGQRNPLWLYSDRALRARFAPAPNTRIITRTFTTLPDPRSQRSYPIFARTLSARRYITGSSSAAEPTFVPRGDHYFNLPSSYCP